MDFLLDLLQGAGIGLGVGLSLLAAPLVALLALLDLGLDLEGTAFSFLESVPAIVVLFAVAVAVAVIPAVRTPAARRGVLVLAILLGAGFAAGSLDDRSDTWWPGLAIGGAAAAAAFLVAETLLARVRSRLADDAQGLLPFYAAAAGLVLAGLSVALPPLAILGAGLVARLGTGAKRREGEKYAGLRILR